jgi:Flp pilus assembly protein protease CpaA
MTLSNVLILFVLLVGSFYGIEAACNLMTYPSDLSFLAGAGILVVLGFSWFKLGAQRLEAVIQHFKKGNDEESR